MSANVNPYTLSFGKQPPQMLSRYYETQNIIDSFIDEPSPNQVFLITGVRGSGKTVMMTGIANELSKEDEWIVINLSPEFDLLDSLTAELGEKRELKKLFKIEGLSVSLAGITIDFGKNKPVTDAKIAVTKMLKIVKKNKKKVLITIDEVSNTVSLKKFASVFQIFLREELPVYLIMTGLYDNIRSLQDEKTLTFLYRAPRIEMGPLSIRGIAENYQKTFAIDYEKANEMAQLTNGYPYAFQLLGFLTWKASGDYKAVISDFRRYLEEYVYEKIYSEMSPRDREVAIGIAKSDAGNVDDIKKILNVTQSEWNPYRKRLIDKGIINVPERGMVSFTLPFFDVFLLQSRI